MLKNMMDAGVQVRNMTSRSGNPVPNQFVITTKFGRMFRSYDSNIAFIPNDEDVIYLGRDWNYSATTGKYRNEFLGCGVADVKAMLKSGKAILVEDL